jgi:sigma-B regulation protein RsbU (phosphoserine phosphatase)
LQHAPTGAPVRVRAVGEATEVRVEVENDGPPIAPDLVRSLFEPFRSGTEPAGGLGGLGLGLYIVRSIVEAHGGSVDVQSDPSRPVTFTIRLPRERPGSRRARVSGIWRPTRAAAGGGRDGARR